MEKSYSYFCAYMADTGEDKFFSSGIYQFPIKITTKKAIRAAERLIAEKYQLDRKMLHLTGMKGLGEAAEPVKKKKGDLPYTIFCAYVYQKNGKIMANNTMVETDFIPQAQSELSAMEFLIKEQEKLKVDLKITDYWKVEG